MGGLAKYMPITHLTFVLGWLAIIGIPPFAGFFSKDEILWQAFSGVRGGKALWLIGAMTAACTAYYMTRLMALTFWGKSRFGHEVHPHESPFSMTIPLMALGLFSFVGGWVGIPHVIGEVLPGHPGNIFESWLHPVIGHVAGGEGSALAEWALMGVSVSLAGLGAWFAVHNYLIQPKVPKAMADRLGPVYQLVANRYYVDEFYFRWILDPIVEASKAVWVYVDVNFIDKATYFAGDLVSGLASFVKTIQNGKTQSYALYMALGMVVIMTLVLM